MDKNMPPKARLPPFLTALYNLQLIKLLVPLKLCGFQILIKNLCSWRFECREFMNRPHAPTNLLRTSEHGQGIKYRPGYKSGLL